MEQASAETPVPVTLTRSGYARQIAANDHTALGASGDVDASSQMSVPWVSSRKIIPSRKEAAATPMG